MKRVASILAGVLLAACGGNVAPVTTARYDFGGRAAAGAAVWPAGRMPIAAVDVQASPWLAGPAMHYRLAFAEPLQRQSYAGSRWAAAPAELLEAFLKQRIVFAQKDWSGAGCRLQLVLNELEQRFDAPGSSQVVLEVQALLTPARGPDVLSRRAFLIRQPAPAADARGGAEAARDAVQVFADDIGRWLAEVEREKPAVAERCRT